jgi:hypothetical protein
MHMAKKDSSAYGEKARGFLSEEIRHHIKDKDMPRDQAMAAAMSEARRKGLKVPEEEGKGGSSKSSSSGSRSKEGGSKESKGKSKSD